MNLEKALLASCLSLRRQRRCIVLLLLPASIVLGFSAVSSILYLFSLFHQLSCLLLLTGQVCLSLELNLLLKLAFVELEAFSQLSD